MNFDFTPIFPTDVTEVCAVVTNRHEVFIGFTSGLLSKYSIKKKVHRNGKVSITHEPLHQKLVTAPSSLEQLTMAAHVGAGVLVLLSAREGVVTLRRGEDLALLATHPVRNVRRLCVRNEDDDFAGLCLCVGTTVMLYDISNGVKELKAPVQLQFRALECAWVGSHVIVASEQAYHVLGGDAYDQVYYKFNYNASPGYQVVMPLILGLPNQEIILASETDCYMVDLSSKAIRQCLKFNQSPTKLAFTFPFVVAHVTDGIEVIDLTAARRIGVDKTGTPDQHALSSSLSSSGHRRLRNHHAIALNTPLTCSISRHPLGKWIDALFGDGREIVLVTRRQVCLLTAGHDQYRTFDPVMLRDLRKRCPPLLFLQYINGLLSDPTNPFGQALAQCALQARAHFSAKSDSIATTNSTTASTTVHGNTERKMILYQSIESVAQCFLSYFSYFKRPGCMKLLSDSLNTLFFRLVKKTLFDTIRESFEEKDIFCTSRLSRFHQPPTTPQDGLTPRPSSFSIESAQEIMRALNVSPEYWLIKPPDSTSPPSTTNSSTTATISTDSDPNHVSQSPEPPLTPRSPTKYPLSSLVESSHALRYEATSGQEGGPESASKPNQNLLQSSQGSEPEAAFDYLQFVLNNEIVEPKLNVNLRMMEQMNQMVSDRSPLKSKEPHGHHSRAKSLDSEKVSISAPSRRLSLYDEYLRENNLKEASDEAEEKARRKQDKQNGASESTHRQEVLQILGAFPSSTPSPKSQPALGDDNAKTTDSSSTASASVTGSKGEQHVISLLQQFPDLVSNSLSTNNSPPPMPSANSVLPYHRAIVTMKRLSGLSSPRDKVACIARVTSDIVECVRSHYVGNLPNNDRNSDYGGNLHSSIPSVGADELVSLLCYVLIQAAVPNLYLEMNYIYEFGHDVDFQGKNGYAFATFQIAVEAILLLGENSGNDGAEFGK